jgi:hypothetical protein
MMVFFWIYGYCFSGCDDPKILGYRGNPGYVLAWSFFFAAVARPISTLLQVSVNDLSHMFIVFSMFHLG